MSFIEPKFAAARGLKPIVDVDGNSLHNVNTTVPDATLQNKLKLLYVYDALLTLTDSDHEKDGVPLPDIAKYISEKYSVTIDRKCFYQIISALEASGISIVHGKGHYAKYYINERLFSIAELKLIADAIASCKILDESHAETLIQKLKLLTSEENATELERRVYTAGRPGANYSEELFSAIDVIYAAIRNKDLISYEYYYYTTSGIGDRRKRKAKYDSSNRKRRTVVPFELVWNDEKYYLLCYNPNHPESITHLRVDRMQNVKPVKPSNSNPHIEITDIVPDFDLRSYMSTTFSMFGGHNTEVKLRFVNEGGIISSVVDQFGADVRTIPDGDEHFYIKVPVKVNAPFFSWVMMFGGKAQIVSPPEVRKQFADLLRTTLNSIEE